MRVPTTQPQFGGSSHGRGRHEVLPPVGLGSGHQGGASSAPGPEQRRRARTVPAALPQNLSRKGTWTARGQSVGLASFSPPV